MRVCLRCVATVAILAHGVSAPNEATYWRLAPRRVRLVSGKRTLPQLCSATLSSAPSRVAVRGVLRLFSICEEPSGSVTWPLALLLSGGPVTAGGASG